MKGYIRPQGKHTWQIAIDMGTDATGKRRRYFETVPARKKGDARKRLNELLVAFEKGIYSPPGRLTLADLLHQWLAGYVKTNCSMRTEEGYRTIVERHLIPTLGQVQIKRLQPQAIQAYYGKAVSRLSPRTVNHIHRVLFEALRYAVRQGYLGRNPADLVDVPSPKKKAMRTLTPGEMGVLLEAAESSYYYPVIYTALNTGLRQAELLGLRWRDIDLEMTKVGSRSMASISVSRVLYKRRGVTDFKEPKTKHSRRRVAMTPKLALFLREYRTEREAFYHQLGTNLSLDDLVFTSVKGEPINPASLSHNFKSIAEQAGLKGLRFHDLRHTFASLMLLRRQPPKVISEALGHSSVAFTMDTYSHIISGMQEDAMAQLDEIMPLANSKNKLSRNCRDFSKS